MKSSMHIFSRTPLARALFCVATSSAAPVGAVAADIANEFPANPVRFIVPFTAGAGIDTTARLIAGKLTELWGQQVVADNRTGATGSIGVDITAHAEPDGYTIAIISGSH